MKPGSFSVRCMKPEDIDYLWKLTADEGWDPDLDDSKLFYQLDPEGFLIGEVDGKPVGCVSALACGEHYGLLGLLVVDQQQRGKGYGLQLWQNAMQRLNGRTICLDACVEQEEIYLKAGFKLAHHNICYKCPGGLVAKDEGGIVAISELPFEEVDAYDRKFFPASRAPFLKAWFSMPTSHAYGLKLGDHLCGYGVIRPCKEGWKVGPLFADNGGAAERLYKKLSSAAGADDWVYMDVPEDNKDAMLLAARFNMEEVFSTTRMYTGEVPDVNMSGIFAITSFARG